MLGVSKLRVTYSNGARGLTDVSFDVAPGEIVAILGRNGAGKTTTLRAVGGFLRSEHVSVSGSVSLEGHDITGSTPMSTFRKGIVLVPERDKVFSALRVSEHLQLAAAHGWKADDPCAFEPLERLRNSRAGLLSGGERQMLALEVALRNNPKLLLVDEASLGLAPVIVKDLMNRLRAIATDRGTSMVVVEQDAAAALRVADRVYVISRGEVVWQGAADATSATDLGAQYLGMSR